MVSVLLSVFTKGKSSEQQRRICGNICSIVGICLNLLLFGMKYAVGVITASVAVIADAFNNLSDAGSSFVTLAGFVVGAKKPDSDHPFGHGRFEYISGFVVSIAILMMGLELLKSSFAKILNPEPVETGTYSVAILLVSILIKLYMACYNHKIGKQIQSSSMKATAADSLLDAAATTVVMISMLVLRFTGINVDGWCGGLVALVILYAGVQTVKETVNPILGQPPEPDYVKQIEQIVMSHDKIQGVHDLVVHDYGPGRRMISLHVEVPGDENIYRIHNLIDHIERELNKTLQCEAVIHMDPVEPDNPEVKHLQRLVMEQVKNIDERITIHDFRIVKEDTYTSLVFDAVVPFDVRTEETELAKQIEQIVQEMPGSCQAVVTIDRM